MNCENIILLVEDLPRDRALTLRTLHERNLRDAVVVARGGVEALDGPDRLRSYQPAPVEA